MRQFEPGFGDIIEFDEEWQDNELTFDLSREFLEQILAERDRRFQLKQPVIKAIDYSAQ